jgi:hypothetical protein
MRGDAWQAAQIICHERRAKVNSVIRGESEKLRVSSNFNRMTCTDIRTPLSLTERGILDSAKLSA